MSYIFHSTLYYSTYRRKKRAFLNHKPGNPVKLPQDNKNNLATCVRCWRNGGFDQSFKENARGSL